MWQDGFPFNEKVGIQLQDIWNDCIWNSMLVKNVSKKARKNDIGVSLGKKPLYEAFMPVEKNSSVSSVIGKENPFLQ